MPRKAGGLTAAKVRTAPPGRYGDGDGLYLLVRPRDARFWLFRYTMRGGKMREMGLGRAGTDKAAVTLAEAREKAATLIRFVRAGVDPLDQRAERTAQEAAQAQTAAIKGVTFKTVAERYLDAHSHTWRNPKHQAQWRSTLDHYAHPIMGDVPVGTIGVEHVLAAVEPIWRTKPETARRVRGRIESVLDYATVRQWRSGENPARWRGHLDTLLGSRAKVATVKHHAALPWSGVAAFVADLRLQGGAAARALEFAILTAARSGEVLGARWSEIDLERRVWTVPAARMKAGREHRVPLSSPAIAVLGTMAEMRTTASADAYVAPGAVGGRPLSTMAMAMLLRRMQRGDITVHGFRSSFRDWVGEATAHPREVAEAALAHVLGGKTETAYARGDLFDKRRLLMDDWGVFASKLGE
ncbi:MAG: DUF4102 domain-containing protein [Alphaproteobacteria bacterium]|nr:DUF4102 domain-containing protein [Alphaproteobacteria bacterium]